MQIIKSLTKWCTQYYCQPQTVFLPDGLCFLLTRVSFFSSDVNLHAWARFDGTVAVMFRFWCSKKTRSPTQFRVEHSFVTVGLASSTDLQKLNRNSRLNEWITKRTATSYFRAQRVNWLGAIFSLQHMSKRFITWCSHLMENPDISIYVQFSYSRASVKSLT